MTDFYEADEPVEKIRAAYERGEKRRTTPSQKGTSMTGLNPVVKAIVAAATAALATFGSAVAAHTATPLLVAAVATAFVGGFIATYSVASSFLKHLAAAILAGLGAYVTAYTGDANTTQTVVSVVLAALAAFGFTASVRNTAKA